MSFILSKTGILTAAEVGVNMYMERNLNRGHLFGVKSTECQMCQALAINKSL